MSTRWCSGFSSTLKASGRSIALLADRDPEEARELLGSGPRADGAEKDSALPLTCDAHAIML